MDIALTTDQISLFAILTGAIVLFVWNRWRYDLVALMTLFAAVLAGVVPGNEAFSGMADPVVVTVATILIISAAVARSGFIDWAMKPLLGVANYKSLQIVVLVAMVMGLSAFMNNVGALAIFLPIAMAYARKVGRPPSDLLMPLAFGSLLGGLITLIGTPPNLLISNIRQQVTGQPYSMFDFAPVGLGICLLGLVYLSIGWRLLPKERRGAAAAEDQFSIEDYTSELFVPEGSPWIGKTIREVEDFVEEDLAIVGIVHENERQLVPSGYMRIGSGDTLIVETDPMTLKQLVDKAKLQLVGSQEIEGVKLTSDTVGVVEAVIGAGSLMLRSTPRSLRLRSRYGVNLLAVRQVDRTTPAANWTQKLFGNKEQVVTRLRDRTLHEGDVVVLQGTLDEMPQTLSELGCLPLAERNLQLGRQSRAVLPVLILAGAVALTVGEVLPISIAFLGGVLAIGLLRILRLNEMYAAIDGPVIILLAAMIPVTEALQTTGGAELLAGMVASATESLSPSLMIGMILLATMMVTPFLNNGATVLLMGPIAAGIAIKLGYSVDPFLMAVAVGASCDFLTPIGHQSNTLVMGPGGYKFTDYWRLGLPLTLLVLFLGTPLILAVWPM